MCRNTCKFPCGPVMDLRPRLMHSDGWMVGYTRASLSLSSRLLSLDRPLTPGSTVAFSLISIAVLVFSCSCDVIVTVKRFGHLGYKAL